MEIIIPENSGFCRGVSRADEKILELSESLKGKEIYILGELINNEVYINFLKTRNILTVEKLELIPDKSWAVIRTHGLEKQIQKDLEKRCQVLNLTCPKVKNVHKVILKWAEKGYFTIINGEREHPETIGHLSYTGDHLLVARNSDNSDLYNKLETLSLSKDYKGLFFVSQTTGDQDTFHRLCHFGEELKAKGRIVEIFNSICPVILKKEENSLVLQKACSLSLVIGDQKSSNAKRLFQRLKEKNDRCYFVRDLDDLKDLNVDFTADEKVLVVSSASTPPFTEKAIIDFLKTC